VPLLFTGKERDGNTGLDYFGARYFSGAQGRFTSPDPMMHPSESQFGQEGFLSDPQRWNKYAYALNNPLRNIDPDGYETQATLDDKAAREAGQGISNALVGAAKGLWNAVAGTANLVNNFINAEARAFTGQDAVGTVPEAQYDNAIQAAAGIVAPVLTALPGMEVGAGTGAVLSEGGTVTRYMGSGEAATALRTGERPNTNAAGEFRPTHVTTDAPLNSAGQAQTTYELPSAPTHRATVPAGRVTDLQGTPDGRPTTSGGGSQAATHKPIPVKPAEIKKLNQ
jgi:RHS repeat-associated protein